MAYRRRRIFGTDLRRRFSGPEERVCTKVLDLSKRMARAGVPTDYLTRTQIRRACNNLYLSFEFDEILKVLGITPAHQSSYGTYYAVQPFLDALERIYAAKASGKPLPSAADECPESSLPSPDGRKREKPW